jgi:hypothetical protein
VAFPCPGCDAPIHASPERWALRCPSCRALVRSRAVDTSGAVPVFEVEIVGRRETRRRVEVAWDASQRRRLSAWLLWSSALTLALVLVLFALARLAR